MGTIVVESHPTLLIPFAILLGAIAIFPLVLKHHWQRHYAKVCAGLAVITCGYYIVRLHATDRVFRAFFVVAGGIHLHVPRPSSPFTNVALLFSGIILASLIGTIGASMLLIRPWLHMNRDRFRPMHLAFFLFMVSNLGGLLLPTGPPLFLGHLKGMPFLWTIAHCWRQWLTAVIWLLLIFVVLDLASFRRTQRVAPTGQTGFLFRGKWNLAVLLGLLLALVFVPNGLREVIMIGLAAGSYFLTPRRIFEANGFRWEPLIEVGWIFPAFSGQ